MPIIAAMNDKAIRIQDAERVIEALGGQSKVARLCGITQPSVAGWKKHGLPKPWRHYFLTIRPDLFLHNNNPSG